MGNPPPIVGPGGINQPPLQSVQMGQPRMMIPPPRLPGHHVPHQQILPVNPTNPNFQVNLLKFINPFYFIKLTYQELSA